MAKAKKPRAGKSQHPRAKAGESENQAQKPGKPGKRLARKPAAASKRAPTGAGLSQSKRNMAGNSKRRAAQRQADFIIAYIANGGNGLQAAITAGFSENGAGVAATRMLKKPNVRDKIAALAKESAEKAGLSIERTLREVARVAYSDVRRLFDEKGQLIPIHLLDDDTAAFIASIEIDEITLGKGQNAVSIGQTKKVKGWDKNNALEKAMKYFGLYEKDNRQRADALGELLDKVDGAVLRPT